MSTPKRPSCIFHWREIEQPDDTHYWWKDMPEPKHFLMVPNAEHSMISGVLEIIPAIGAFVVAQFSGQPNSVCCFNDKSNR